MIGHEEMTTTFDLEYNLSNYENTLKQRQKIDKTVQKKGKKKMRSWVGNAQKYMNQILKLM